MKTSQLLALAMFAGLAFVAMPADTAEAQACPIGRACFYVPPALPTPPTFSVDWDMVISSPRGTITGTWRAGGGPATAFSVSPGMPLTVPLSTTEGTASGFGTAESRGIFIEASSAELVVNHRLIEGPWQSSSTIKSSAYALGQRFRLGSYNLDVVNTTSTGYDYTAVYAPFGGDVTFQAPPGAPLPFWEGRATASFTVSLTAGQTYIARTVPGNVCNREQVGGLVTATDSIAVSIGGRGWSGGCSTTGGCGDDGADNILPVTGVGTQYVIHDFPTTNAQGEDVAVVADVAGTEVRINGVLVATLNAGQVHIAAVSGLTYIETSQPATVYQNSGRSTCEIDVAIIPPVVLAPLGEWVTDFNVVGTGDVGIVIATTNLASLRLDGLPLVSPTTTVVPGRLDLTGVRFTVGAGNHTVRAAADFQLGLVTSTSGTGLFGYFTPFRIPGCGDGSQSASEGCDDGNLTDGDGCSSSCRLEIGQMGCTDSGDCVPAGRCDAGTCVARCSDDASCNDSNPCTADSCNGAGACENVAVAAGGAGDCSGGQVCSGGAINVCVDCASDAQCSGGRCLVATNTCVACLAPTDCADDGNECTARTCVANACGSVNVARGTSCSLGICDANVTCSVVAVDLVTPANDSIGNEPRPVISGTATPGITVVLTLDGTALGMTTADATGAWTFTPSSDIADGVHTVIATVMGGMDMAMDGADFTVDTTTSVAITAPVDGDRSTNTTPTISGTGEVGAMVTVMVDGMMLGIATVGMDGTWTIDVTTALADGTHSVAATSRDAAGNMASDTSSFTVDLSTTVDITSPAIGERVMTATPTISGTGEPGASVVVSVDGTEIGTVTVAGDGTWSIDVTSALAEGTHTVEATATDTLGNMAAAGASFEVDLGNAVEWLQPEVTGDTTPELSGTGEPGATVEVSVDGSVVDSVVVDAEGNWTLQLTTPLAVGNHTVSVESVDEAGNEATDSGTLDVELPGPRVEIRHPADNATTRDTMPIVTGSATPGSVVLVVIDGTIVGHVRADERGMWSLPLTEALAAGEHLVLASVTDRDAYTTVDAHRFTVVIDGPRIALTGPPHGGVTNDATPTLTGTTEANATVQVFVDGVLLGTVTADGDGNWSLDVSTPLNDGEHVVRAVAIDDMGRTATDTVSGFVDTETEVEIVGPAEAATVPGPRPTISGTAEPGATVVVSIDGTEVGSVIADAAGLWSVRADSDLAEGTHTVGAVSTDAAGNVATDDGTFSVSATLDSDGDGLVDTDECPSEPCRDSDMDGTPDYLDPDDDEDGVPTALECPTPSACTDSDADTTPDYLDPDDDGDGILTVDEGSGTVDTDADGFPDHLDVDDDGDGLETRNECPTEPCRDTDTDGTPDYLDPDDDGDDIPTTREIADSRRTTEDVDGDGDDNWLDADADGEAPGDREEGIGDSDMDGIPDYLDPMPVVTPDAGVDAGTSDGGTTDGGTPSDGGAPVDAATGSDAGTDVDAGGTTNGGFAGGAGCAAGGSGGHATFALLMLGWLLRRRRED
ncbi:MAG: hypothetical protein H6720_02710 [Sandaracinus sp.]|nr:hypothetical protein [Sandaracinus sp.]